jgi:predicted HD phosphohydrolase
LISIIEKIIKNYKNNKSLYIGEKITMTEHMIQSAMLAEKNKSSTSLVCASLLHDYGHFILDNPDELVNLQQDGEHEEVGYQYLKKYFKENVIGPIKNHVKAKRFLARDKKYHQILSPASIVSLRLQGGIMNNEEAKVFQKEKFFNDSIKLRKFDEAAKKIGMEIKDINEYKDILISNLL